MKQTAVEWLDRWFRDNPEATHEEGNKALQQANKMFEQQMKEAVLNNVTSHPRFRKIFEEQFDHWFNETYGSKGNDEYTEINWGGVIQKIPIETNGNNVEKVPNVASAFLQGYEQVDQNNPVTRGSTALVKVSKPTSSQTEISDEEREILVHKKHCFQGEYEDTCKYGKSETCPARKNDIDEISDDVDIIMDLAEKSRNALNDVAHLCSGEVEEHIFDMGFYQGYKAKDQTEISDEEIEEYAKKNAFQYYEFITGAKWYREQLKQK